MKSLFFPFICLLQVHSLAQTAEHNVDNIYLKVPASWQMSKQATFTQFTLFDKNIKSFCQLVIYNQQPSSGNKLADFNKEWGDLVEKNFTMLVIVKPITMKDKLGNTFLRFGANGRATDGNKYYVQLNMYDCGSNIQSFLVTSGSKELLAKYDSLWQPLIVKVSKQTSGMVSTQAANGNSATFNNTLAGTWHKSSSGPPQYVNGVLNNLAYSGYTKGQYTFNTNGTYVFQGELYNGINEFGLTDEIGSWSVTGNQLSLTPSKSLYRAVDLDGKLKRTENISKAKRIYTWTTHYYEGIQETSLILTAKETNAVDGGFSDPGLFPNSFIYSPGARLEFRFLPNKF